HIRRHILGAQTASLAGDIMNEKIMALALALSAALAPGSVLAQEQPPPRVIVTGEGEATMVPDMALLALSVMREAATAREALDANSEAMAAVLAAMKEF